MKNESSFELRLVLLVNHILVYVKFSVSFLLVDSLVYLTRQSSNTFALPELPTRPRTVTITNDFQCFN